MPSWNRRIKDYFQFSRTEQQGLTLLFVLLVVLVLFNLMLPVIFPQQPTDYKAVLEEIKSQEELWKVYPSGTQTGTLAGYDSIRDEAYTLTEPFYFNPNTLPDEGWLKLGLTDRQIRVIRKYLEQGGIFRKPSDLAKIYSISQADFERLKPYIDIPEDGETKKQETYQALVPKPFDPNTVSREELLAMGIRESLADNLIHYRAAGGRFENRQQFRKLYSLEEAEYVVLEPFLLFPTTGSDEKPVASETSGVIEINSADSLDLQRLQGIGPGFANRIVKYREMLGGYYAGEQLLEVYGMDSVRFAAIASSITVDASRIRKIDINQATLKELMKHPYIEFYLAKSIVKYRGEHGNYSDLRELLNARLMYEDLYFKIVPYLDIGNAEP